MGLVEVRPPCRRARRRLRRRPAAGARAAHGTQSPGGQTPASISSYLGSLEPEARHDLELINERRALLAGLTRKYGDTVDGVIAYGQRASDRLLELDGDDDRIAAALQQSVEQDEQALGAAAAALTAARTKAAADLRSHPSRLN